MTDLCFITCSWKITVMVTTTAPPPKLHTSLAPAFLKHHIFIYYLTWIPRATKYIHYINTGKPCKTFINSETRYDNTVIIIIIQFFLPPPLLLASLAPPEQASSRAKKETRRMSSPHPTRVFFRRQSSTQQHASNRHTMPYNAFILDI